jgi:hypothetical protein
MALLRLRYEAECLTSQITKQNLGGQPLRRLIETTLPRERFSPLAASCLIVSVPSSLDLYISRHCVVHRLVCYSGVGSPISNMGSSCWASP